ncbi:hypothetical protein BDV98DRAFT_487474, partial [Pterulicium gracile]
IPSLPASPRMTEPAFNCSPAAPRPLPSVPNRLLCKLCNAAITNHSLICTRKHSQFFRGFLGQAKLYVEASNTILARPKAQLMLSGAHVTQLVSCATCEAYLGYKIISTRHKDEQWKEGRWLLECE